MSTSPRGAPPPDNPPPGPAGTGGPPGLPALLRGLVDDTAMFPQRSARLGEAVWAHSEHRASWYGELVGPLLVPASILADVRALADGTGDARLGVIGDTGVAGLQRAIEQEFSGVPVGQIELAVAKRGEDPVPGTRDLIRLLGTVSGLAGYAEVPLTMGLLAALELLAEARAAGLPVSAKFRTGGLAAELFPTPIELAAVICACRDRRLPFKFTAGLHHAIRHTDPETGFVHHGFLNALVAAAVASDGGEVTEVAAVLAGTDPVPLAEAARAMLDRDRPLWIGFGSSSIHEPVRDLVRLGLLRGGHG